MINKLGYILFDVLLMAFSSNAQSNYAYDRVYTANQVSNTVSVIDPGNNKLLGEIRLGTPYPNVLSPLYKGQVLVHGIRYSPQKKLLAVVSIGSNSVSLISTETNQVIKTIYVGRSPHEPTFTPDSKQLWVSVRGESYISVIDVARMKEIKRVLVADGPGMVAFSPDGKLAYICSSFTSELDVVDALNYKVVKRIPVVSSFSPNIFTSPDGKFVAMTHKDVGKVTVIDAQKMAIVKVINTGAVTNHVTFSQVNGRLLMFVTVGGENNIKVFDVANDFTLTNTINTGALPHGIWPSANGKLMFVGLEYGDQVQSIDLENMQVTGTTQIGQSPQALVYADNAVTDPANRLNLTPLNDSTSTQVSILNSTDKNFLGIGRIAVRAIGLADLIEQIFTRLNPRNSYTLALSFSHDAPFTTDYSVNTFATDENGKYSGQSTGLIKTTITSFTTKNYQHIVLVDNQTKQVVLVDSF